MFSLPDLLLVALTGCGTDCLLWYGDIRALAGACRSLRQSLLPQLRQIRAEVQFLIGRVQLAPQPALWQRLLESQL